MKRLLIMWDPDSPVDRVSAVVAALRELHDVKELTFRDVSHRTSPNGSFTLRSLKWHSPGDAVLWIEGGPLPSDLEACGMLKVGWFLNAHLEPTILDDLGGRFDRRLSTSVRLCANEACTWMPLAQSGRPASADGVGLTLSISDPKPPSHALARALLHRKLGTMSPLQQRVSVCIGLGEQPHDDVIDEMAAGRVVVVDPSSDLRGIAHVGDHALTCPSLAGLPDFLDNLSDTAAARVTSMAPRIVEHLHSPAVRAEHLTASIWSPARAVSNPRGRPTLSILVNCFRYVNRLRICLQSIACQDIDVNEIEVIVADPQSDDNLADELDAFGRLHPALRIVHLPLPRRYYRNRGLCINRAFDVSAGSVIAAIDGDIIFKSSLIRELLNEWRFTPNRVLGLWRVFLSQLVTEQIIRGDLTPQSSWNALEASSNDEQPNSHRGVLGYCQLVSRTAFATARYPEEFDVVNQSDVVFIERLQQFAGVQPRFLANHRVLHLWHPRNWEGTTEFL